MAEYIVHVESLDAQAQTDLCQLLDGSNKGIARSVLPGKIHLVTFNKWTIEDIAQLPSGIRYDILTPPPK